MVNEVKHESRQVAMLEHDDKQPVWKIKWIHDGLYPSFHLFHWRPVANVQSRQCFGIYW